MGVLTGSTAGDRAIGHRVAGNNYLRVGAQAHDVGKTLVVLGSETNSEHNHRQTPGREKLQKTKRLSNPLLRPLSLPQTAAI